MSRIKEREGSGVGKGALESGRRRNGGLQGERGGGIGDNERGEEHCHTSGDKTNVPNIKENEAGSRMGPERTGGAKLHLYR